MSNFIILTPLITGAEDIIFKHPEASDGGFYAGVGPSITNYSDTHTIKTNSEAVFGRSDPIYTYQNTERQISVSFMVGEGTQDTVEDNYENMRKYIRSAYPSYSRRVLKSPPLIRLQVASYCDEVGYLTSVSFDYLDPSKFTNIPSFVGGASIPKNYSIKMTFNPIHKEVNGFDSIAGDWLNAVDGSTWPFAS
jgi:hypothetical protein